MKKRYIALIIFVVALIVAGVLVFINLNNNNNNSNNVDTNKLEHTNKNVINEETKPIVHIIKGERDSQTIEFDIKNDLDEDTDYALYAKDLDGTLNFSNLVYKDSSTGSSTYQLADGLSPDEISFYVVEKIPAHSIKHIKLTFYINKKATVEDGQYIKFEICSDTWENVMKRQLENGTTTQEEYDFGVKVKEVCEMLGKESLTEEEVAKYIGPEPEHK